MGFSLKKLVKGAAKIATGDVLGGIGSIAGGVIGSKGAKKAGAASAAGMREGAGVLTAGLDRARADYQPYVAAGNTALNALADPAASFESSPGYAFARDQGLDAIKTQQNSLGRLASGNTLAALTEYGTGIAQQDFGNWWDRQSGLAGMGLNATGNMATVGAGYDSGIANLLAGAGGAKAAGIQGATDAWGNAISDIGGFIGYGSSPKSAPGASGAPVSANINDMGMTALGQKKKINLLSLGSYGG